ncbi:MAG: hypothetical protein RLZZ312_1413 [Bacteroidota bacterium]
MSNIVQEFNDYRAKMNEKLLADDTKSSSEFSI